MLKVFKQTIALSHNVLKLICEQIVLNILMFEFLHWKGEYKRAAGNFFKNWHRYLDIFWNILLREGAKKVPCLFVIHTYMFFFYLFLAKSENLPARWVKKWTYGYKIANLTSLISGQESTSLDSSEMTRVVRIVEWE